MYSAHTAHSDSELLTAIVFSNKQFYTWTTNNTHSDWDLVRPYKIHAAPLDNALAVCTQFNMCILLTTTDINSELLTGVGFSMQAVYYSTNNDSQKLIAAHSIGI